MSQSSVNVTFLFDSRIDGRNLSQIINLSLRTWSHSVMTFLAMVLDFINAVSFILSALTEERRSIIQMCLHKNTILHFCVHNETPEQM